MDKQKTYIVNPNTARLGDKTLYANVIQKNYSNIPQELKDTRYFSGGEADIYFGDTYIDETTEISFAVSQNTMPVYGYNSYVFDDIAQGSRVIQGTFTVNFTRASYLYDVLNTLSTVKGTRLGIDSASNTRYISQKETSPMWNKCFELVVSYGGYGAKKSSNTVDLSTIIVLKGVRLVSSEQQLNILGEPVFERYAFIARDIDFAQKGTPDTTTVSEDQIEAENFSVYNANFTSAISNNTKYYKCQVTAVSNRSGFEIIGMVLELGNQEVDLYKTGDGYTWQYSISESETESYAVIDKTINKTIDVKVKIQYIDENNVENEDGLTYEKIITAGITRTL